MIHHPLFWLYLLAMLAVAVLVQVLAARRIGRVIRNKIPDTQLTARIVVWFLWWWIAAPLLFAAVVGLFWLLTWTCGIGVTTVVALVLDGALAFPFVRGRIAVSTAGSKQP